VTETGGEVGLVRDLPGVAPELVRALVESLTAMEAGFADFAAALEAGSVHEHAFGKLIDAAKVRDAYHERLPATRVNLAEAGEVARDLRAEFAAPATAAAGESVPVPPQREALE
jgi:hypothetical protein